MRRPTRWTVLSVGLALTVGAIVVAVLLALPTLAALTETVTTRWRSPGNPVGALWGPYAMLLWPCGIFLTG